MATVFSGLRNAGYGTVLLWGSEFWLKRDAEGDPSWLSQAQATLRSAEAAC